ncbi:hypothetical protein ACGFJ5_05570 [Micromonospora echinaurantiaca]|uniref:hypothetical protein n=1 Tax=Micromonospora echinaurantiaca TaxID=47857 RepID=UPI003720F82E
MLAGPRAADQQVVAAVAVQQPAGSPAAVDPTADQVTVVGVVSTPAVRTPGALPPGAADPAARNRLPDLAALIETTLRGHLAGDADLRPLLDALDAQLSPDPGALQAVLQEVWDQTLRLGTEASKAAMRGRSWSDAGAVEAGLAPLLTLAPVVTQVASSLLATFGAALPPVTDYPDELQAVLRGMAAFGGGLRDGLTGSGLCELQFYEDIYAKFCTSMQEHMLIASTVVQAGMVIGIGERLVEDLIGIVALILLLSSGPILVAVLCYAGWTLWQAGAEQVARETGGMLAAAAAEPFLKLHAAPVGVEFLLLLGRIMGPIFLDAILLMIGEGAVVAGARNAVQAARMAEIWAKLKTLWATLPDVRPLLDEVAARAFELLDFFKPALATLGTEAEEKFLRLLQREQSDALLVEIRDYLESLSEDPAKVATALGAILDFLDDLSEEEFAGLLAYERYRPYSNASPAHPGPQYAEVGWVDLLFIQDMEGNAKELFALLGPIAGRLCLHHDGICTVLGDYLFGGGKYTGAAGVLLAARQIIDERPDAWVRFEVDADDRVLDIVAYGAEFVWTNQGFRRQYVLQLVAEVKTYPSGTLTHDQYHKLLRQMRKDLVRHATSGDPQLELLSWLIDPVGYQALNEQLRYMFWEALHLEHGNLVNQGVDYLALEVALMERLEAGLLLSPYRI